MLKTIAEMENESVYLNNAVSHFKHYFSRAITAACSGARNVMLNNIQKIVFLILYISVVFTEFKCKRQKDI